MEEPISGHCPVCDGEFQPAVTECPDCGVPLLRANDLALPDAEDVAVVVDEWGTRLDVVAVVAAGALLLLFAASAIWALTVDAAGGREMARYQRVQLTTQVGTIGYGGLLFVAVGTLCLRRWLRDDDVPPDGRSTAIELVVIAAAVIVTLCAVAGAVNELAWLPGEFPRGYLWFQLGQHVGAGAIGACATWLVTPEVQRSR